MENLLLLEFIVIVFLFTAFFFAFRGYKAKREEVEVLQNFLEEQGKTINELNVYIKKKLKIEEWRQNESNKAKENPSGVIADVINANNAKLQNNTEH